jgi:hypothetical protein
MSDWGSSGRGFKSCLLDRETRFGAGFVFLGRSPACASVPRVVPAAGRAVIGTFCRSAAVRGCVKDRIAKALRHNEASAELMDVVYTAQHASRDLAR